MMAPKVLVIAYDFPPHGAIGTMRTLRVVRRLSERGWRVDVLTGDPATYLPGTPIEKPLLERVPYSVRVFRARAWRGASAIRDFLRRLRAHGEQAVREASATKPSALPTTRWGRPRRVAHVLTSALTIPDKEAAWILPAVLSGLRAGRPDILYSSAPPWSGQLVARILAAWWGCPWVADFRDPWARAPWREERLTFTKRAAQALERQVVGRANAVLFVTRANMDEFSTYYGAEASRRFHLVPNGCDPAELERVAPAPRSDVFVLLHAGTLYGSRNPMPLIEAIARGINRGVIDRARFRLRLLGKVSLTTDLAAECQRLNVADVVEFVPRVPREDGLREMVSASALLLLQPGTTVSVPGKAYEYLAAGRPILAVTEEGETAELVRVSGVGVAVRPDEPVERIEAALLAVIGIAARPFARPSRDLYDGNVWADTVAQFLSALLLRSDANEKPATRSTPEALTETTVSAPQKGPR